VNKWISDLRQLGYANTTVATIVKVFSMILTDAADEHLIPANPIRRYRRRGRRSHRIERERVWATPTEVLRIAEQAGALGGDTAGMLIITAAWTGCRWGELTGLQRDTVDLDRGVLIIDPRTGALHESAHTRWLGSPKTPSSARTITLPPFLITMLRKHLEQHDNEFVFTAEGGTWLWRSTFIRRVLKPAVNGNEGGLNFHGSFMGRAMLALADLTSADLSGAWLGRTNLRDAILIGCNLQNAVLRDAILSGTNLAGANLCGTDLSNTDLAQTNLQGASFDEATIWPHGFGPPMH
jgi:integrase